MEVACLSAAAGCQLTWEGVGAVATALATVVALALPMLIDHWRLKEEKAARKARIREAISIVDQVLAYHEVATSLIAEDLVYHEQFLACVRIAALSRQAHAMMKEFIKRPDLSDGVVACSVAGLEVATAVNVALRDPVNRLSAWNAARSGLERAALEAELMRRRSARVREDHGLQPSTAAKAIHDKYDPMIAKWMAARIANTGSPVVDVDEGIY